MSQTMPMNYEEFSILYKVNIVSVLYVFDVVASSFLPLFLPWDVKFVYIIAKCEKYIIWVRTTEILSMISKT